jgi:anti-anti-sigma factor
VAVEAGSQFPPAPLRVRHDIDRSGSAQVILTGEIDLSNVDSLARALAAAPYASDRVVIDLAGVTFLDSTGIAALVVAQRRAVVAGRRLTVANAQGMVRRVLDLTGALHTLAGRDLSTPEQV